MSKHEIEVLAVLGQHHYQWTGRSPDTCAVTGSSSIWCGLGENSPVHKTYIVEELP